jgi:two-component system, chemotaxis family, chemotaxis protein CheY
MKTLIVEDELTSRIILQKILSPFGEVHLCYDGNEAIDAFCSMLETGTPFDLICMDFMMPEIDGHAALTRIRAIEKERGILRGERVKVIMTTGLSNIETEYADITSMCDAILLKPIRKDELLKSLQDLGYTHPG